MHGFRDFARACAGLRRFLALDPAARSIVFYAEDAAAWVHLEPVVTALRVEHQRPVAYLTSDPADPGLRRTEEHLHVCYVGRGIVRTYAFWTLRSDVMVLTTPDLEVFHVKRSRYYPVHYVYLHHSIVSMHTIYRERAFDYFDAILCVGPHHVAEARALEQAHGRPPRALPEHGYSRLDSLMREGARRPPPAHDGPPRVLLAPTWGPEAILEAHGHDTVAALLDAGCHVTIRPHPRTALQRPEVIAKLREAFGDHPQVVLETDVASAESLFAAHVMVSDWSGVAAEFAFGLERPVLFIDVARKVNNPNADAIPCEPFEVLIRSAIGTVISPAEIPHIARHVRELRETTAQRVPEIRAARDRWLFNVGQSGRAAADYIVAAAGRRAAAG